ncbi:MAG: amidohydrolase [Gemmatimonadetes bacterium]|nr:amidohydrolase [Gemmatimonadota bacterium]
MNRHRVTWLLVTVLLFPLPFSLFPPFLASQQPSADLVVTNAKIYTVDASRPHAEALAVRGGRVVFVGDARGAQALVGPNTEKWDLRGKTVVPGIVDAHAHLLGFGGALRNVDLVGTKSYDEVVARVVERAKTVPPGDWVQGRGWDQNDWAITQFPTHDALSRAVPNHPVYLTRVDGHAALANARALQLAAVTAATKDPDGGRFIRDARGNPTGVLIDNAQSVVRRVVPNPSRAELRERALLAIAEANKLGLTGIHDAGVSPEEIDVYLELAKEGKYNLRNYVMIRSDDATLDRYMSDGPKNGLHDGRIWIRSIKISSDGALGSRGAAMLEPYADEPGNSGLIRATPERLRTVGIKALKSGFQLNVHAIGDRANRMALDMFEAALNEVPTPDHRFRIEHAQILHWDDIPRFAKLGVIPSMQGSHQTSDMYWATTRVGPTRVLGAYAWRSLLNSGVVIPNGSDFPVESANPLISFHAFFTREDENNWPAGGWHPEQKTTRDEALLSMTLWPAYSAFMENEIGSLTPGKYADFVVLDQDIMTIAAEQILKTTVEMTVLGGKVVYRKPAT